MAFSISVYVSAYVAFDYEFSAFCKPAIFTSPRSNRLCLMVRVFTSSFCKFASSRFSSFLFPSLQNYQSSYMYNKSWFYKFSILLVFVFQVSISQVFVLQDSDFYRSPRLFKSSPVQSLQSSYHDVISLLVSVKQEKVSSLHQS